MLLSICIPSWNRGTIALENVRDILSIDSQDFEVVLSNNGSDIGREEYGQIRDIQDPRLVYSEFAENQGMMRNICQVIKLSRGNFCMLLSDEDRLISENLPVYLEIIRNAYSFTGDFWGNIWDMVGVIFGSTIGVGSTTGFCYTNATWPAGEAAIKSAYMKGNYISGLFFNRQLVTNEMIDGMLREYKDNLALFWYPHMVFITAALVKGRCIFWNTPIVQINGIKDRIAKNAPKPVDNVKIGGGGVPPHIPVFAVWDSRLEQMKGFCQQIKHLEVDEKLKFWMLTQVYKKTLYLFQCTKSPHLQNGLPWLLHLGALIKGMVDYLNTIDPEIVPQKRRAEAIKDVFISASLINGVTVRVPEPGEDVGMPNAFVCVPVV